MADARHAVMEADRTVHTRNVVNRLQNEQKIIKASEHWKDDHALPLPAQMFRNPGKNYYAEEQLGDQRYFTAVYADVAVTGACISCHNEHQDSPRNDFKLCDVMGGVVVRIPLQS